MSVLSLLAEVLFVGHSLVGPNLPPMLQETLRRMQAPYTVEAQIINGAPLAYNWDHSADAQGVDARQRLAQTRTDVLILTEAQPFAGHVQWSDTVGNVARFATLAAEKNPDVQVYLYETWPSLRSGPGTVIEGDPDAFVPWRARLTQELSLWEGVARDASAKSGVPVRVMPVGQAMGVLADEIAAGKVDGFTAIDALFADDIHPNGKGFYFVAMVQAAVVTGKSPEGLPAKITRSWLSKDAVMTDAQAAALQRVAWQAVQSYAQPSDQAAVPAQGAGAGAVAVAVADAALPKDMAISSTQAVDFTSFAPIANPNLALGLAGVNDWSVQQPFLDIMKTARPWTGHLPGQWGGWGHEYLLKKGYLDERGWPKAVPPELTAIATLILTDLPVDAAGVAGRYVLTYQGQGDIVLEGRGQVLKASPGSIEFDFTPGEGGVIVTLKTINPTDPIRNITVVRQDRAALLAQGALFNPDWLTRIRGVKSVRFMDWMATNNSVLATSVDRPKPTDYTWARIGVPMEVMVALANELQADPWFTMPHLADDGLIRDYATMAHLALDANLVAYVEYSNEVWNWQFDQANWAEAQGKARWGQDQTWVQFYALRAAEMADIWAEVFADNPDRLVRIIAMQTGWFGLESQILDAPLVIAEGRDAPGMHFDAYAVTGYFSAILGAEAKIPMIKDWIAKSKQASAGDSARQYDLANTWAAQELRDGSLSGDKSDSLSVVLQEVLPYHAKIAKDRGLRLMMYEGGSHVVGYGAAVEDAQLTAFLTQLNYAPEMGALYQDLLAGWAALTDAPFNAFVDVYPMGKWGSWGALRHLGDDNPRWQALAGTCGTC
jgi:hypothetical protein